MGKEDAILNSNQLNKIIGMIIPPPETKKIIEKAAMLVAKKGENLESNMENSDNPAFSFLKEGDPYNNYYRHRVNEIKEELMKKQQEESEKAKENENKNNDNINYVLIGHKKERDELIEEKNIKIVKSNNRLQEELRMLLNSNISQLTQTSNENTISKLKDIKAPKPDQFSISHPNISGLDMDIIKITAQYIARNGQKFLSDLSERESKNPQFNFLKPQHNLFGYFTYLVGSYSKILSDKKEKIKKLVQYSSDKETILKEAHNRVLYEKKIKKMQKSQKFNENIFLTEEEKKKNQMIDWYDFVVVDVIDFDEVEENSTNNINNNEIVEEGKAELQDEQIKEEINTTNIKVKEDEREQLKEQPPINIQSYDNEEVDINNTIEEEPKDKEKEEVPKITHMNNMKIVKNYVRQPYRKIQGKEGENEIKCPLCKSAISADIFQEHLRNELLDPKWKQIQQEIAKRKENSSLAETLDSLNYLGDFSKSRPDLFGDVNDIRNFEQKKKNEPNKPNEHQIWSGYNPYMSRTTANITMFKQQNKKHIEESKKAALANNSNQNENK